MENEITCRELLLMFDKKLRHSFKIHIGNYVSHQIVVDLFRTHKTHKYIQEYLYSLNRIELANDYIDSFIWTWNRYEENKEYLERLIKDEQFINDLAEFIDLKLNKAYKKWNYKLYNSVKGRVDYHYIDNYERETLLFKYPIK